MQNRDARLPLRFKPFDVSRTFHEKKSEPHGSLNYKLPCLVLLLEMLVVSAPILRATDLTGGVVGLAGPRVGVGVALFEVKPNKTFRLVRQTVTAPDGKYHFTNVHPGQYVLRIGRINYPLEVRDTQMQDIPVIAKPRH